MLQTFGIVTLLATAAVALVMLASPQAAGAAGLRDQAHHADWLQGALGPVPL